MAERQRTGRQGVGPRCGVQLEGISRRQLWPRVNAEHRASHSAGSRRARGVGEGRLNGEGGTAAGNDGPEMSIVPGTGCLLQGC